MMTHEFIHMAFPDVSGESDDTSLDGRGHGDVYRADRTGADRADDRRASVGRFCARHAAGIAAGGRSGTGSNGAPGGARTGAARSSGCWRTWGFARRRIIERDCRMRCAGFLKRAATSRRTGRWSAWSKWAIKRRGRRCSRICTQQMKATAVHTDLDDLMAAAGRGGEERSGDVRRSRAVS